ncbi:MAG: hypothetical protein ABSC56_03620 [Solirubrobacteraceae bacterium]
MAVLTTIFNCLALNLALLVACLPIVTVPAAFQAGIVALDRWRNEGEDRVVREFLAALRSRPFLHATMSAGVPFVGATVALEEVHFFSHGGAPVNWLCLGLGVDALLLSLATLGYSLVLGARRPDLEATDLWYVSVSLAARNLFWGSPLIVAAFAALALLLLADPALALIGLPLALLGLVRLAADPGIRRADLRARGEGNQL